MQSIGLAGFVDNGKTQFAKSIVLDPRKLDVSKAEQKHQMTMDTHLEYVHNTLNDTTYLLTDAPGHNVMLSKAISTLCISDIRIYVLSCNKADGGLGAISRYKQIFLALGIKKLIIALTKIDLVAQSAVYTVIQTLKVAFKQFTIYILPYTTTAPSASITLLQQYLSEFTTTKVIEDYVLRSFNCNNTRNIAELKGAVVGLKRDVPLLDTHYYIAPLLLNNKYICAQFTVESQRCAKGICTIGTSLAYTHAINNQLSGCIIKRTPIELHRIVYLRSKLNFGTKTLLLILDHFQTFAKIKSIRNAVYTLTCTIPIPNDLLHLPAVVLKTTNEGWQYVQYTKLSVSEQ